MRLFSALLLAAMVQVAIGLRAIADELPAPPMPPVHPPAGEIAPVPNLSVTKPLAVPTERTSVDIKFFHARSYDPSLGFAPGSRYRIADDRKAIQPPGFSINVPLK